MYTGDYITLNDVKEALKQINNWKRASADRINAELLKYGRIASELRMIHSINER